AGVPGGGVVPRGFFLVGVHPRAGAGGRAGHAACSGAARRGSGSPRAGAVLIAARACSLGAGPLGAARDLIESVRRQGDLRRALAAPWWRRAGAPAWTMVASASAHRYGACGKDRRRARRVRGLGPRGRAGRTLAAPMAGRRHLPPAAGPPFRCRDAFGPLSAIPNRPTNGRASSSPVPTCPKGQLTAFLTSNSRPCSAAASRGGPVRLVKGPVPHRDVIRPVLRGVALLASNLSIAGEST